MSLGKSWGGARAAGARPEGGARARPPAQGSREPSPVVFRAGTKTFRLERADVEIVVPRPVRLDQIGIGIEGMVLHAGRDSGFAGAPSGSRAGEGGARVARAAL